jgi:ribosome-associated translation inhibitor RaiA
VLHYWLPEELAKDAPLELVIIDTEGETIRRYTRKPAEDDDSKPESADDDRLLTAEAGLNRLEWNLRYPSVKRFDKLVLWNDYLDGPRAVPGIYSATLTAGESALSVPVEVRGDPRSAASAEDLKQQFDFAWSVNRKLTETHEAITRLRKARDQVETVAARVEGQEPYAAIQSAAEDLVGKLDRIEETLYQTRLEARQDPLNFPIRLNDKLAGVMLAATIGDHPPTASAIEVRDALFAAVDEQLLALEQVLGGELDRFNALVAESKLPAVVIGDA